MIAKFKFSQIIPFSIVIFIASFFLSSHSEGKGEKENFVNKSLQFIIENKDNQYIEFPFIHQNISEGIPMKSHLILDSLLKKKGFHELSSGRGNYPPRGPRILSKVLKKVDCYCEVNLIYYSTVFENKYEMAERIKCMNESDFKKEKSK